MDDALPSVYVAARQGCRFLLFSFAILLSVTSISSFDLKIRPHRLDWILEGTSLEFICSLKNRTRPEAVVWKNVEKTIGRTVFGNACAVLKSDPRIDITCDASSSKLRILGVRSMDRWNLHCQTGNGTARSQSVKVKVLPKSKLILSPKTNPLIKEEGSSATMSCRVEGQGRYPFAYPSFTWFKNDVRIVQSTFISTDRCLSGDVVSPPDNLMTLCGSYYSRVDIRNISLDDAGLWHCEYGPHRFDIKSQQITIIVKKKATTTAQDLQTTHSSVTDSPTFSSEHLLKTGSEMTSPNSIISTNGMTTNEQTEASSSSTTSSTTTTTPSTQSSTLSSTYKKTLSYPKSETMSTVLQTSSASTATSKSFSTSTFVASTTKSTFTSSTTLPTLTPIPTSMSMPTSTKSTSPLPTSSTLSPKQTPMPTSLSTEISTLTSSSTSFKVTSTSSLVSILQSNSTSKSYQTLQTTVLQTSPELITQSNHDDFSADSKPIVSSSTNILTTISSPTRLSTMMADASTPNLNGSDVTGNNGSTRGVEVVLEGGTTHASLILICCIIVAVVAFIIIVTAVVIIRRRKNRTAKVEESTLDVRVDISTQTTEDGMDTLT